MSTTKLKSKQMRFQLNSDRDMRRLSLRYFFAAGILMLVIAIICAVLIARQTIRTNQFADIAFICEMIHI